MEKKIDPLRRIDMMIDEYANMEVDPGNGMAYFERGQKILELRGEVSEIYEEFVITPEMEERALQIAKEVEKLIY